jgi:uncharacterized protein YlxW (UPF0749 family)
VAGAEPADQTADPASDLAAAPAAAPAADPPSDRTADQPPETAAESTAILTPAEERGPEAEQADPRAVPETPEPASTPTEEAEQADPRAVPETPEPASTPTEEAEQADPRAVPETPEPASTPTEEAEQADPRAVPEPEVARRPEPPRPADHLVEASPAAYGPESVSTADFPEGGHRVPPGHVEGKAAWRRLFRMSKPRTTKANALGAVLAIALGVGIATQVQLTNERGLSELSQSDLIRLLDDISARSSRLDQQIRELETTRDRLVSGTGSTGEALEQAQRRADTLGILAGTIGAQGPGIAVSISDPDRQVSGPVVLDLIQELRDAGAESIEVGGVRLVASSYVGDSGGDLSVDGRSIRRPILVNAIGDPNTLASAMTIPGGIVETIRQKGANASVNQSPSITISSIHTPAEPVHAEPVE